MSFYSDLMICFNGLAETFNVQKLYINISNYSITSGIVLCLEP